MTERNAAILAAVARGETQKAVAGCYGVSPQYVNQLVLRARRDAQPAPPGGTCPCGQPRLADDLFCSRACYVAWLHAHIVDGTVNAPCGCDACAEAIQQGHFACSAWPLEAAALRKGGIIDNHYADGRWEWVITDPL